MELWIPYYVTTLIIGAFSLFIASENIHYDILSNYRKNKKSLYAFYAIMLILLLFCCFKMIKAPSIDEYAYRNRFNFYEKLSFFQVLENCNGEYINGILVWVSTLLFKNNQGIFIVFGLFTSVFYLLSIRKYCKDFTLGIILLMVMGIINTSFNITQQCLASAIFVYYSDLMYEKSLKKFFLLTIICFFIHNGSIVLIFFYYIINRSRNKINPYIITYSIIFIIFYKLIPILSKYFPMLETYVDVSINGHDGVKLITILIACTPAILAFLYRNNLKVNDKITLMSANMCFVQAAIYIACFFDRYIARLALYTSPFCLIFLSRCDDIFEPKSRRIFKIIMIICYSIELYLRIRGNYYIFNFQF